MSDATGDTLRCARCKDIHPRERPSSACCAIEAKRCADAGDEIGKKIWKARTKAAREREERGRAA